MSLPNIEATPWRVEFSRWPNGNLIHATVYAAKPRVVNCLTLQPAKVADCGMVYAGIPSESLEAHAHLIAAAPELYEALEAMIEQEPDFNPRRAIIGRAMRALAKARGEKTA